MTSALYLPASNPRAIEKARELDVEAVILDLEDAVAPEAKGNAREQAAAAFAIGNFRARKRVVRINGLDTPWGLEDLSAVARMKIDAVLVPKVSRAEMLDAASETLPEGVAIWAMIETPLAILNIAAICAASEKISLTTLVVGTNDLAKELRVHVDEERTALLPALSTVVFGARAYGLDALDGVYNAIDDDAGFSAQCRQGRSLGFDGKTLIHPRQIPFSQSAWAPSQAELEDAHRVIAAFADPDAAGKGALRVAGRMVERLHLEQAKRTVLEAARVNP